MYTNTAHDIFCIIIRIDFYVIYVFSKGIKIYKSSSIKGEAVPIQLWTV